ncbi:bifunctional phosphoribosylaminoimidazolecarboxamide formyltransferase/IMP cyclohydrolase [Paludifilum halophilum]|uniref:Bifunctional purine biosynthesis protein PurH n=1 Tax=Paludifilum halophilum TaxID=1642702 RepID=A0A235B6D0_9BACL|nr:bifunctional phosphoribosylaminoimidazolecarboxamide formyltransferase/IMP cyclohydrolase [Paludifilum halophilum]OYD07539.1 bifunctional phosphoribosylaminoimidazolecarboxamide formyltransferase/IMP cyclohydrolase [Paludifilum halophilum]
MNRIRRALISVSDKTGILELATELSRQGVEIVSTGGTQRALSEGGIPVIGVSELTGFPEILDGRVKTLHPRIHAGLLAVRDNEGHTRQLEERKISLFDLVVVNLYPFEQTVAQPEVRFEEAIENIDIGGPSMVRAAAKNHRYVTVLVDPDDYGKVLEQVKGGEVNEETRRRLAAKAFRHTAAYDAHIARFMSEQTDEPYPEKLTVTFEKVQDLRYGENPHQPAAFYRQSPATSGSVATAEQLHGKELSYNNINDANAALEIVSDFDAPTAVAVKHMNPCGVGTGTNLAEAYQKAYEADSVSIFGGIIAVNRVVDVETARRMKDIFLEIVMAPDFEPGALEVLKAKKNLRLLRIGKQDQGKPSRKGVSVRGGLLVQGEDRKQVTREDCEVVTRRKPSEEEWAQLLFAWKVVKHVKSNAIVLARDNRTVGVGAGQMNRVGSARIAIEQAGESSEGSVLSSDAFFPMKDTVEAAAEAGITAIIQPGGSIRDRESIEEADKHGIAMVFTGTRHFKH